MTDKTATGLNITPVWARFNDGLIRLVDCVPDDKINWSPKPELWNFRGVMLHIAAARDGWLSGTEDAGDAPGAVNTDAANTDVWQTVRSKEQIKAAYARTWERLSRFLSDPKRLDATYDDNGEQVTGHWIAFHLLEHDVHHRADLLHYLALLGIEHPGVGTP